MIRNMLWIAFGASFSAGGVLALFPEHRLHSLALFFLALLSALGARALPKEYDE